MNKRISRRELKEQIKELKWQRNEAKEKTLEAKKRLEDLQKRFDEMGSHVKTFDVSGSAIRCIEIKPEDWGNYLAVSNDVLMTEEFIKEAKEHLVSSIAAGLMENNLIQIIKGSAGPFYQTIGAKVYVVPWDKMVDKIVLKTKEK